MKKTGMLLGLMMLVSIVAVYAIENCADLQTNEEKDKCYIDLRVNGGDDSLCDEISNKYLKDSCASISNSGVSYFFVIDDKSPAEDIILIQDILSDAQLGIPSGNVKLNSEVTREDLPNKVTTFIYRQSALIIVGDTSPTEHVVSAQEISSYLRGRDIPSVIRLISEIKNDDFKQETVQKFCGKTNTLGNDETKTYRFPDHDYEISLKISNLGAVFTINGEITDALSAGTSFLLADGEEFFVDTLSERKSTFCINGGPGEIISALPQKFCGKTNTLGNDETKTYKFPDNDYEISLTISNSRAVFTINGEITDPLSAGTSFLLADGEEFFVDTLSTSESKFCINGGPGTIISVPSIAKPPASVAPTKRTMIPSVEPVGKEPDECSTRTDCDDYNACTSDLCSGTPKKCSHIEASLGCNYNGSCIPASIRYGGMYCEVDRTMQSQKEESSDCNNNYECDSNVCVNSKCISPSFIQRVIEWFGKIFG